MGRQDELRSGGGALGHRRVLDGGRERAGEVGREGGGARVLSSPLSPSPSRVGERRGRRGLRCVQLDPRAGRVG